MLHGPSSRAAPETVVRVTFKLPAVFARRRCLFGHLQRLEDEHGGALVVAPRSRSMRPA